MDGWNTTFPLGFGLFSGAFAVSLREGTSHGMILQDIGQIPKHQRYETGGRLVVPNQFVEENLCM